MPLSIGALLVVTLVVQLARPEPMRADRGASRPLQFAPEPMGGAPRDYPRILARPMFTPARGVEGPDQAVFTTLSDYTLVGVTIVNGRGSAILRSSAGDVVNLRAGEALLGWRVAQIGPGGIILQQGDIRRAVPVSAPAAPKPGAQ